MIPRSKDSSLKGVSISERPYDILLLSLPLSLFLACRHRRRTARKSQSQAERRAALENTAAIARPAVGRRTSATVSRPGTKPEGEPEKWLTKRGVRRGVARIPLHDRRCRPPRWALRTVPGSTLSRRPGRVHCHRTRALPIRDTENTARVSYTAPNDFEKCCRPCLHSRLGRRGSFGQPIAEHGVRVASAASRRARAEPNARAKLIRNILEYSPARIRDDLDGDVNR